MKIKTITCHDVYNSGASLQAYALMKYLQELKHDVEIIDYKPDYLNNHYKLLKIGNKKYEKNFIYQILYLTIKLPGRILSLKTKKKYDDFKKNYLNITNMRYTSNEDLKNNLPIADTYIAGSDQIWNTMFKNGKDPAFYLDFVPDEKNKLSYAASFALDSIPKEFIENTKKMLNRLDNISVRETSGLNVLESMNIKGGIQVLDPVFLLDKSKWENLCVNLNVNEKYVFVYDFDKSVLIEKIANHIAKEKKLKIYTVFNSEYSDKYLRNMGPQEFITYIKNAEYIVSNSFHATAFSIIFQKKFYVIDRKEEINARMRDLLTLLSIEDRLLNEDYFERNLNDCINYKPVLSKLEVHIGKSKEYLDCVLRSKKLND